MTTPAPHRRWAWRCAEWVERTYGAASLHNLDNRVARIVEEAVELGQAQGLDQQMVERIVHRAYSRPKGEVRQEAAGVLFTFLVWAKVAGVNIWRELRTEVERVERKDPEFFRAKQRDKFAAGTDLIPPT